MRNVTSPQRVEFMVGHSKSWRGLNGSSPPAASINKVHVMFHVSRIKPVTESELSPPSTPAPLARIIDGAVVFTVERILNVCHRTHSKSRAERQEMLFEEEVMLAADQLH